jgi:hypothetical protein
MSETGTGIQSEVLTQAAGKTLEAMNVWAETNQRVLRELVELGTGTAKESIRLCAELQRSALEALRESQASGMRGPIDPAAWYRHAVRMAEENAVAVTRAAERMQAATESAGKGIQDSCAGAMSKLKDIYAAA